MHPVLRPSWPVDSTQAQVETVGPPHQPWHSRLPTPGPPDQPILCGYRRYIDPGFAGDVGCRHLLWWYIHRARRQMARSHCTPPDSRDVGLATDRAADYSDLAAERSLAAMLGMVVGAVVIVVV